MNGAIVKCRTFLLSVICLLYFVACTQHGTVDLPVSLVSEFVENNSIPGLSVTVSKGGEILWSEGFGYADLEQQVKVDPAKTKFRIGSVSKTLTATAIALLMEEDKLDLDVPIQQYVPEFPQKKWDFTLRQLGGHLAGIRHYRNNEFLLNKKYATVDEGLEIFKNDTLLFQPGTQYTYSSYGWNLISAAVEKASADNFLNFMQRNVFMPVNMDATLPDYQDSLIIHRTRFYVTDGNGTVLNAPAVDNSYKWAGGGFLSTTEDLTRFGNAILKASVVSSETMQVLFKPQQTADGRSTEYGIGWRRYQRDNGDVWYGHSGGSVGGTTIFVLSPEKQMVVAIVANLSSVSYDGLQFEIADFFLK